MRFLDVGSPSPAVSIRLMAVAVFSITTANGAAVAWMIRSAIHCQCDMAFPEDQITSLKHRTVGQRIADSVLDQITVAGGRQTPQASRDACTRPEQSSPSPVFPAQRYGVPRNSLATLDRVILNRVDGAQMVAANKYLRLARNDDFRTRCPRSPSPADGHRKAGGTACRTSRPAQQRQVCGASATRWVGRCGLARAATSTQPT